MAIITFDANGGYGDIPANIVADSTNGCIIGKETPKSDGGRVFMLWNTKPDGRGISYKPGSIYHAPQDVGTVTLYAMYSNNEIYLNSDGSVECLRFIEEADCNFPRFQKDGTIVASNFIEHTLGIMFGNGVLYANSFIEPNRPLLVGVTQEVIATLIDTNGVAIVDNNDYTLIGEF